MDWRAKHPKLAKWFNSIAKTPAMEATQPPAA
jgi:glutathione S-transferase